MIFTVKFPVKVSVSEAKIRAQIDYARIAIKQRFGELCGNAMRKSEKNDVGTTRDARGIGIAERNGIGRRKSRESGKDLAYLFAKVLPRSYGG